MLSGMPLGENARYYTLRSPQGGRGGGSDGSWLSITEINPSECIRFFIHEECPARLCVTLFIFLFPFLFVVLVSL